jgi:hypothetical protein
MSVATISIQKAVSPLPTVSSAHEAGKGGCIYRKEKGKICKGEKRKRDPKEGKEEREKRERRIDRRRGKRDRRKRENENRWMKREKSQGKENRRHTKSEWNISASCFALMPV